MRLPLPLISLCALCAATIGCGRHADDRVLLQRPVAEQDLSTPIGHAIVATRPAPQARIADGMVVLGQGRQAVYVQQGAFRDLHQEHVAQEREQLEALLRRLDRLLPPPPAAPSDVPPADASGPEAAL